MVPVIFMAARRPHHLAALLTAGSVASIATHAVAQSFGNAPDAGIALAAIVDKELPVRLDATQLYPSVSELPGGPFHPTPLVLSPAGLYAPLPHGDYTTSVVAYPLSPSATRPVVGAPYQFGPMEGKSADALAALFWNGTLARMPAPQLQQAAVGIMSGTPYSGMPNDCRRTLDQFIPQWRGALNGGLSDKVKFVYGRLQAQSSGHLPPLKTELTKLGPIGLQALNAISMQADLALDTQKRVQVVFASFPSGVESGTASGEAPWTKTASGAYIRLRLTGGSLAANELQVRVPAPDALPGSVSPASLFGARTDAGGKLTVTGLVAYAATGQAQVLNLYPLATAQ